MLSVEHFLIKYKNRKRKVLNTVNACHSLSLSWHSCPFMWQFVFLQHGFRNISLQTSGKHPLALPTIGGTRANQIACVLHQGHDRGLPLPSSKAWLQSSFCGYLKACLCLVTAFHNTSPDMLKALVPLSLTAMPSFNPPQLPQIIGDERTCDTQYHMFNPGNKEQEQLTSVDGTLILMQNKLFVSLETKAIYIQRNREGTGKQGAAASSSPPRCPSIHSSTNCFVRDCSYVC